ncbi:TNF receptor-associated factor 6-A isoform X5 [Hydra vulgaris]|uniref:TNF receptor-associated factor 6-A isoform X5 n=1 Tax=Hydra vulgaris TaxID=6087 RepID=UPI001F5F0E46|nr:TNF receptor-associated factor 6-A-like isoform X5 [Hydra vulgaris]
MENLDEENFGGYDAYFINELLDNHECPVCQMALREPIQTQCGHRLCLSCAEEMRKRNKGVLICPLDNSVLNPSKIFPDKAIERAIMQLKVKCSNVINGCEWTGELKILNEHLGSCEYQTLKCLNKPCSSSLLRKKLNEHMEKHCIYRLVTCHHCKQKIIFSEMQIHEENCECLPLCCVNQCGMKIMRNEMSSHITNICANEILPCQYLNIGCKFKKTFASRFAEIVQYHDFLRSTIYLITEGDVNQLRTFTVWMCEGYGERWLRIDPADREILLRVEYRNLKVAPFRKLCEQARKNYK